MRKTIALVCFAFWLGGLVDGRERISHLVMATFFMAWKAADKKEAH